jgi:hypothetical protein
LERERRGGEKEREKKKGTVLFAARFLWNVVCSGDFFSEILVKQCLKYV